MPPNSPKCISRAYPPAPTKKCVSRKSPSRTDSHSAVSTPVPARMPGPKHRTIRTTPQALITIPFTDSSHSQRRADTKGGVGSRISKPMFPVLAPPVTQHWPESGCCLPMPGNLGKRAVCLGGSMLLHVALTPPTSFLKSGAVLFIQARPPPPPCNITARFHCTHLVIWEQSLERD